MDHDKDKSGSIKTQYKDEANIREIKIQVYAKRQTRICTTSPSFPLICRVLFITSTQK